MFAEAAILRHYYLIYYGSGDNIISYYKKYWRSNFLNSQINIYFLKNKMLTNTTAEREISLKFIFFPFSNPSL